MEDEDDDDVDAPETYGGQRPGPVPRWRMDGMLHTAGGDCCAPGARAGCGVCRGVVHAQGVYGGMFYRCEKCGATP